jgi:enterobactin synthetase component F
LTLQEIQQRHAALLSPAELGLWYAQRVDPRNPVFNTGQYIELRGALALDAFRNAVRDTVDDTDVFAHRIVDTDDGPRRVADETARPLLQEIDLSESPDPEAEARLLMQRDMAAAVDLQRDALAAQVLFRLAPDRFFWYLRIHHLAIDGYGTALFVGRVCHLYHESVVGSAPAGRPFGRLVDVLDDDARYEASPRFGTDRQFWLEQFADRPEPASLSTRVALTSHTYLTRGAALDPDVDQAIAQMASASDVVWPDVLVALSAAYVERHTGGGEAIVGMASMERLGRPAARVPAMVMNILPARVAIDEDVPLSTWLSSSARRLQRLRRHGRYRGEQVRRDLGLAGGQRRLHGPLINVLPFDALLEWPDLVSTTHVLGTGPVDDLTITWRADGAGKGLRVELDGNPALYTGDELAAHAARLASFVTRAAAAKTLGDVATLDDAETHHWVHTVNNTAHDVPDTTLAALMEERMRMTPDAPALEYLGSVWTYRDLDVRSAALAGVLAGKGVGRGSIVGVVAPRSFELVLALVAIVRAGAAYMPIGTDFPPARVAQMIDASAPILVLTHSETARLLPAHVLSLDIGTLDLTVASDTLDSPTPDDPAYIIFTSGSTGAPKGAVIDHRAIVNRLEWMRTFYGFTEADRLLQKTPATFDVSVWEFFLAFTTGATLVVAPPDAHRDPAWLASIIRNEHITTIHFVPSMLAAFLDEPTARGLSPTRVFCSGEELPAALRDRFHTVVQAELHNLYGPTEAAVDVTWWNAGRHDTSEPVPIGFPVWNTQMYVLDGRLRPVPSGVVGDLYIAGVQLARGYLNREDLTEERFVPNPFVPPGSRMYKTGDLARWRPDGALAFLGRSDFQVKIRGFRIELGEIETVLASSGLINQVVVVAREDRPGDRQLVAYVVPRTPPVDMAALRELALARLPEYMVPSAFIELAELPLSANGKLQRSALPAPDRSVSIGELRPPRTETEAELLALFSSILTPPHAGNALAFGIDDDFFTLGGHSLLAAQLMVRVRQRWGIDGGLGMVFAHPTVARLAGRIDVLGSGAQVDRTNLADLGFGPVIPLLAAPDSSQSPLFCVHPAGGLAWCYTGLARALRPIRSVYGLQAAALDTTQPLPESLDDMAADYIDQVRRIQPQGPYAFAGWSVGGILAHAMAVQLRRAGESVSLLAMIDSYPCDRWRDEAPPDESIALRALLLVAGHDPDAIGGRLDRASVVAFLKSSGHPLGTMSDDSLSAIIRVVHQNNNLVRRHRHEVFDGDVVYFRAGLDHVGTTLSPLEWRPYVSAALDVYEVTSMHAHLMGPAAVASIAGVLNQTGRPHNRTEPS